MFHDDVMSTYSELRIISFPWQLSTTIFMSAVAANTISEMRSYSMACDSIAIYGSAEFDLQKWAYQFGQSFK